MCLFSLRISSTNFYILLPCYNYVRSENLANVYKVSHSCDITLYNACLRIVCSCF